MSRRNPFRDIEEMVERMQQQLEEELGGVRGPGSGSGPGQGRPTGGGSLAVDVEDRDEEYVVTADLPGYDREDIDIELIEDALRISAEHEEESETGAEEGEGHYVRRERRRQSMSRTVSLPGAVDADAASASFTNGVLTVTIPKVGGDEGHEIDIE
jgi:HSP20 family protein